MEIIYSLEKKDELYECNAEELRDFTLSIHATKLQVILKKLPEIKGFRYGKDGSIVGKAAEFSLLTFFRKIRSWSEDEWNLMAKIWMLWTSTYLLLSQFMKLDSEKEFEVIVNNLSTDPKLRRDTLLKIIKENESGSLTQSVLDEWYRFSPFPPDQEVTDLINLAPSKERQALEYRFSEATQKLKSLDQNYHDLNRLLKGLLTKEKEMSTRLLNSEESFDLVSIQLQEVITKLEECGGNQLKIEKIVSSSEKEIKSSKNDLKAMNTKMLSSVGTLNELLGDKVLFEDYKATINEKLMHLNETISSLQKNLESALEKKTIASPQNTDTTISNEDIKVVTLTKKQTKLLTLEDAKSAILHLTKNLNGLGIKFPQARRTALEVLSALVAGQLVTFNGPLGRIVAERCAVSLAGQNVRFVRIPVGLLNSKIFDNLFDKWNEQIDETDIPLAIILEGLNNSAIEVYAPTVRQLIIERQFGLRSFGLKLLLFATLEEGPSAIPVGKGILELGPIFSTNSLGWMDKSASTSSPGIISCDVWKELTKTTDLRVDWDELFIPDWLIKEGGQLWLRTLKTALFYYLKLSSEIEETINEPLLNRLSFGWILPFVLFITPEYKEEILQIIDQDEKADTMV